MFGDLQIYDASIYLKAGSNQVTAETGSLSSYGSLKISPK